MRTSTFVSVGYFALLATTAACGSDIDDAGFGGGGEGGHPTTTSSSTTSSTGSGLFTGCEDCEGSKPICFDDASCEAVCPPEREACAAGVLPGDPPPAPYLLCCDTGAQCCPGGGGVDFCAPAGEGCPVLCPDGTTTCANGTQCQLDTETETYSCVDDCSDDLSCGDICCPLGSKCVGGQCPLPDLSIDVPYLEDSIEITENTFQANACVIQEGCVAGPGDRRLLRFSLKSPNTGEGDLFLGNPQGNDLFEYSTCHDHFHFIGYAQYRLLDENQNVAATGHKQAFCLLDFEPIGAGSPEAQYDCGYQGISSQWSDIYSKNLPCQWVDITDVPSGDYSLEISLNFNHTLAESSYDNNMALVPVHIEGDSCPNGCRPTDPTCCAAGDPCGWGADGSCDCGGFYDWDAVDCGSCLGCEMETTCVGGCTLDDDPTCCTAGDPCGLAGNDICDCEGTEGWDAADCLSCVSSDVECASVDTCPEGCTSAASQPQCCVAGNPCGYDNDGWCDCSGEQAWDAADCFNCQAGEPDCPN